MLFECGVARLAAIHATDADIARLGDALAANEAARGNARRFEQSDVAFHYVLACITGNPIFSAVHDALVEWLTSQRTVALRRPQAEPIALAGHRRILDAVAARDAEAAGQAMERHLEEIAELIRSSSEAAE